MAVLDKDTVTKNIENSTRLVIDNPDLNTKDTLLNSSIIFGISRSFIKNNWTNNIVN